MSTVGNASFARALGSAISAGLRWRFLMLWVMLSWIPTLVIGWPLRRALGAVFDHAVPAAAWARHFHWLELDGLYHLYEHNAAVLHGVGAVAVILTLLLAPLMSGMIVASGRAGRGLGFAELLRGGFAEYGRMLRLDLWALLPLALVAFVALVAVATTYNHMLEAVLPSQAHRAILIGWLVVGMLWVMAHAGIEAGRARFIVEPTLRSAGRALWRGYHQRPVATIGMYLIITALGLTLLLVLAALRGHIRPVDGWSRVAAFAVTQGLVMVIGWMRAARLLALAGLVADGSDTQPEAHPVSMTALDAAMPDGVSTV